MSLKHHLVFKPETQLQMRQAYQDNFRPENPI